MKKLRKVFSKSVSVFSAVMLLSATVGNTAFSFAASAAAGNKLIWGFEQITNDTYVTSNDSSAEQTLDSETYTDGSSSAAFAAASGKNVYYVKAAQVSDMSLYTYMQADVWLENAASVTSLGFGCGAGGIAYEGSYSSALSDGWNTVAIKLGDMMLNENLNYSDTKALNYYSITVNASAAVNVKLDRLMLTNEILEPGTEEVLAADSLIWGFESFDSSTRFVQTNCEIERPEQSLDTVDKTAGNASLKYEAPAAWNVYWLNGVGLFDITQYKYITFDFYAQTGANISNMQIGLGYGGADGYIAKYSGVYADGWNKVCIPTERLEIQNTEHAVLNGACDFHIGFNVNNSSTVIRLDNMLLTNSAPDIVIWNFDSIDPSTKFAQTNTGMFPEQSLDTADKTAGSASVSFTGKCDLWNVYYFNSLGPYDLTAYNTLSFDIYVEDYANIYGLRLSFGKGGANGYYALYNDTLTNGWNTVSIPLDNFSVAEANAATKEEVYDFAVGFNVKNQDTLVKLDNCVATTEIPDKRIWNFETLPERKFPQTGTGEYPAQSLDYTDKTSGNASVSYTAPAAWNVYWVWGEGPSDLTKYKYIRYDLWLEESADVSNVQIRCGKGGVDGFEGTYKGALKNGWNIITIPVYSLVEQVSEYAVKDEIYDWRISFTVGGNSAINVKLDNLVLTNRVPDTLVWGFESFDGVNRFAQTDGDPGLPSQYLDGENKTEGTYSVAYEAPVAWNAYWIKSLGPFNTTLYDNLSLDVWVENPDNISAFEIAYGYGGTNGYYLYYSDRLENGWNRVTIPLSSAEIHDQNMAKAEQIYDFHIGFRVSNEATEVKFDNLRLFADSKVGIFKTQLSEKSAGGSDSSDAIYFASNDSLLADSLGKTVYSAENGAIYLNGRAVDAGLKKIDKNTLCLDGISFTAGDIVEIDAEFADSYTRIKLTGVAFRYCGVNEAGNGSWQQLEAEDANGDGSVNILDLIRYKKAAAQNDNTVFACRSGADLNSDGSINAKDIIIVRKVLLNK